MNRTSFLHIAHYTNALDANALGAANVRHKVEQRTARAAGIAHRDSEIQ